MASDSFLLCARATARQSSIGISNSLMRLLADILALWGVEPHRVIDIPELVLHRLELFILRQFLLSLFRLMEPAIDGTQAEVCEHAHRIIADGLFEQGNSLIRVAGFAEFIGEANLSVGKLWLCGERLLILSDRGVVVLRLSSDVSQLGKGGSIVRLILHSEFVLLGSFDLVGRKRRKT